jgi:hypothetical protein
MTPRLSKAQREALARQDAAFLPKGLIPGDPRSSEAHLRQTAALLADRQAISPCGRAVAHVTALFERSIPPAQTAMLACRQGCAFCCRQPVSVTAPEAIFLAAHIRANLPDKAAAVAAFAAQVADRRADAPGVTWLECALLGSDGNCGAYRARPIACHAQVSVNVEDCKASFLPPHTGQVMEPRGYTGIKDLCRLILLAAMQAKGLPLAFYEMNAAVAVLLATEDAEKRWLEGEDVLAGVATITPLKPDALRTVQWLAQTIAPTL